MMVFTKEKVKNSFNTHIFLLLMKNQEGIIHFFKNREIKFYFHILPLQSMFMKDEKLPQEDKKCQTLNYGENCSFIMHVSGYLNMCIFYYVKLFYFHFEDEFLLA